MDGGKHPKGVKGSGGCLMVRADDSMTDVWCIRLVARLSTNFETSAAGLSRRGVCLLPDSQVSRRSGIALLAHYSGADDQPVGLAGFDLPVHEGKTDSVQLALDRSNAAHIRMAVV